jgi:hypothetical protein
VFGEDAFGKSGDRDPELGEVFVFPDVESGGRVEEVGAIEEGSDATGRGFYFHRSLGDECSCELLEAVEMLEDVRRKWGRLGTNSAIFWGLMNFLLRSDTVKFITICVVRSEGLTDIRRV